MGIIRGGLTIFIGIILFLSLLILGAFLTLNMSINQNNIEKNFIPLSDTFEGSDLNQTVTDAFNNGLISCQNSSNYAFTYSEYDINMSCDVIYGGEDAILEGVVDSVVDQIYYKEYNCGFWNCFEKEDTTFLISQKSKDYWGGKAWLFLLISLILAGIIFLLVENKLNWLIFVGSILIVSSFLVFKLESFFASILGFFSPIIGDYIPQISDIFFGKSFMVFIIFFLIGFIVLAVGISFKFVNLGFMKDFFQKHNLSKNMLKDDVTKPKKK